MYQSSIYFDTYDVLGTAYPGLVGKQRHAKADPSHANKNGAVNWAADTGRGRSTYLYTYGEDRQENLARIAKYHSELNPSQLKRVSLCVNPPTRESLFDVSVANCLVIARSPEPEQTAQKIFIATTYTSIYIESGRFSGLPTAPVNLRNSDAVAFDVVAPTVKVPFGINQSDEMVTLSLESLEKYFALPRVAQSYYFYYWVGTESAAVAQNAVLLVAQWMADRAASRLPRSGLPDNIVELYSRMVEKDV